MNIQHGYYSHSFMKFPENFKISQIGSSDDLQPPLTIPSTQIFINMISVSLMENAFFFWKPTTCIS